MSDIKTGTVVRGLKNQNLRPFSGEDLDMDGRLMDASVNCIEGSTDVAVIIVGMDPAMHRFGTKTASVQSIIKKGGRVMKAEIPGRNENHCQIFGLKLSDANSLFS